MNQSWISTESALPADGQPVQFVLHRRSLPIAGTYSRDGFRSRWTHYAQEVVCKWRGLLDDEEALIATLAEQEDLTQPTCAAGLH